MLLTRVFPRLKKVNDFNYQYTHTISFSKDCFRSTDLKKYKQFVWPQAVLFWNNHWTYTRVKGEGGRGAFATHQAPALMYNSITKFSGSDLYPLIGVLMLEKACIYNFNANKCPYLALWLDRPIILSSLTAQMWSPTPIRPSSPTAPPFRTDLTTHPQPSSSPFRVKPGWSAPWNWAYWKHV